MQCYRNLLDPVAHLQTRTAIHGHHGVRVDLGDVLDQLVLELRQIEAVVETFTFVFVAVTHGNHNGVIAGQVLRCVQRSRAQLHTYQAAHGRQVTGATRVLELHIVRLASFQIDLGELWNGRRDAVARQWLAVTVVDDFLAVDPQTHGAVGTNLEHLLAALGRGDLAGVANRSRRCIAIQFASGRTFAGVRIGRRGVAFERQVLVVGPVQVNMLLGAGDSCITRPVGVAEVLDLHALDFIASCVGGGPGTGAWVQRQAFDEVDLGVRRDLLQTAQLADVMAGHDVGAAETGRWRVLGQGADNGDFLDFLLVQRQQIVLVFQQDDTFTRSVQSNLVAGRAVHVVRGQRCLAVELVQVDLLEDASDLVVDGRSAQVASVQMRLQHGAVHLVAHHVQIGTGAGGFEAMNHSVVVALYEAFEAPFLLQDLRDQVLAFASEITVHFLEGAHHHRNVAVL